MPSFYPCHLFYGNYIIFSFVSYDTFPKSGGHKNPRLCELCGCKRNTSSNLLLHYTKQHFMDDIKARWGQDIVENTCNLCDEYIETSIKNVGEAEKWIHLGHKHSRTNQLLLENGKSMIIIKGYNDHDFSLLHSMQQSGMDYDQISSKQETFASSEDEILSSPVSMENMSELYQCSLCDKTTKNQNLLDLHLIAIHYKQELLQRYGNPQNSCQFCNKIFQNVDAFTFHIGKDHDLLKVIIEQENSEGETTGRASSPSENYTKSTESKVSNSVSEPQPQQPAHFNCFKCGAKRRGLKELYGHYSLQHFSKELMEEFGVQKKCNIDDCGRNLENGTAWVSHLGKISPHLYPHFDATLCITGQEHPEVLDKYISKGQLLSGTYNHVEEEEEEVEKEESPIVFSCPLKCSSSFSSKTELLSHFKSTHGFSNEIIQKVLKAHPRLNSLSDGPQGKRVEA